MKKKIANKLTLTLNDSDACNQIVNHFLYLLGKQDGFSHRPLIMLCIGSDRYIGDALGPLIGSHLQENTDCTVYGTLEYPVHAGNLIETINSIQHQYHHPIIVAIDACLGKDSEIGNIEIWEGGLQAGIAVGNYLPCVGTISIIGVVNAGGHTGYLDLQSTPLGIVIKLSKIIARALEDANRTIGSQSSEVMILS
jgi:putative sporulation protein YyaC